MTELTTAACKVVFVPADLANLTECRNILQVCDDTFGTVDILVNAGATTARGSIYDTTPEDYDRMMNVNTRAPFFLMQDAARIMERDATNKKQRGGDGGGSIINISSTLSYGSMPMLSAYGMSKGALNIATKNIAYTLMWSKIRVNAIAIGWMDSPGEDAIQRLGSGSATADWKQTGESNQPFGRLLKTDEVARCIGFCASDESGMMTGSVIDFDQSVLGAGNAPVPPPKNTWPRPHWMKFKFNDDDKKDGDDKEDDATTKTSNKTTTKRSNDKTKSTSSKRSQGKQEKPKTTGASSKKVVAVKKTKISKQVIKTKKNKELISKEVTPKVTKKIVAAAAASAAATKPRSRTMQKFIEQQQQQLEQITKAAVTPSKASTTKRSNDKSTKRSPGKKEKPKTTGTSSKKVVVAAKKTKSSKPVVKKKNAAVVSKKATPKAAVTPSKASVPVTKKTGKKQKAVAVPKELQSYCGESDYWSLNKAQLGSGSARKRKPKQVMSL